MRLESLEERTLLAAVPFSGENVIVSSDVGDPLSIFSVDLDSDGDRDVVVASHNDNTIAWYENRLKETSADFGPRQVISTNANGTESVFAADLDGDGDQDVLSASKDDDKIAWYENRLNEPAADFGPQQVISTSGDRPHAVIAADLDGDGDPDVLSASSDDVNISWYENRLNEITADFGPQQGLVSTTNYSASSIAAADMDGDGDLDVLPSRGIWFENRLDELTADFQERVITSTSDVARSVYTADLDGDGLDDLIYAEIESYNTVSWIENRLDEVFPTFGSPQTIASGTIVDLAISVFAADLDGDGDRDALSASRDNGRVAWYENRLDEGTADFGPQQVLSTSARDVYAVLAVDLDDDGDQDVLSAARSGQIAWYENRLGEPTGDFVTRYVHVPLAASPRSVITADLDGDGDQDVLSASHDDDKIAWYENGLDEPIADFAPQQVITTEANGARAVFAADLDGDGDQDVLSASSLDDKIAWYKNRLDEATGDFGPQQVITTSADSARSVFAADLDGDGDQDVLSASSLDDKIAWYENRLNEPAADFGPQQVITTSADGARSVFTADLDGDGDPDILSASERDDKIAWYENRLDEATADFAPQQVLTISADFAYSVFASDLDGDGDPDVLSVALSGQNAWYENRLNEAAGDFGPQQVIGASGDSPRSVFASDLDGDGDPDVLSASVLDHKIAWYRNELLGPLGDMDLDNDVDLDDVDDFVQGLTDPEGYQADHGGLSPAARGDIDGDGDLDLDDVDGFVELLIGPASGGGQASADSSTSHSTTNAAERKAPAKASPAESPTLVAAMADSSGLPEVAPRGATLASAGDPIHFNRARILPTAPEDEVAWSPRVHDAVFAAHEGLVSDVHLPSQRRERSGLGRVVSFSWRLTDSDSRQGDTRQVNEKLHDAVWSDEQ